MPPHSTFLFHFLPRRAVPVFREHFRFLDSLWPRVLLLPFFFIRVRIGLCQSQIAWLLSGLCFHLFLRRLWLLHRKSGLQRSEFFAWDIFGFRDVQLSAVNIGHG